MISDPYSKAPLPPIYVSSPIDSQLVQVPTFSNFPESEIPQDIVQSEPASTQISTLKVVVVIAIVSIPLLAALGVIFGLIPDYVTATGSTETASFTIESTENTDNSTETASFTIESTENTDNSTNESDATEEETAELETTIEESNSTVIAKVATNSKVP